MAEEKKNLEKETVEEVTTEAEETIENAEEQSDDEKKPTKDKEKSKNKKKNKLEEKLAELEEQRMRQLAEFENFRKRSEKEKSQMFEIGAKTVVEKILPVIDNFERGLAAVSEEQKDSSFVQGMELVYKQILTTLEEIGVKPIEAVGQEFDPNLHNAVMMVDDDDKESGTVAEEMQKGYMYKESVVRHSMVKVVS